MQSQILKRACHHSWACSLVIILTLMVALMPAVANAAPVASANYSGVYYWVQPGDTLSEIAVWHGTTTYAIMQANGINNPNRIYVGQKLYIPQGYGGGHHDGGWDDHGGHGGPVGGPQCAYYHTVQYGQTLSAIAAYYGVNAYTLAQVNAIYNWNHVYAGQQLCIPGGYYPQPQHPNPQPPKPQPPKPQPPAQCTYVVRYGDTLDKIAYWYGTTVNQLVYLNNLYNVNQLYVGQLLYVPGQNCQQPPAQPEPTPPPADGWTGSYFNNKYFEGSPVLVRQDGAVNFDWGGGGPGNGVPDDRFSAVWERTTYVTSGTYRFYAMSDDGVRVYVDGHLIIDQWNEHPTQSFFGDIYLGEGNHSLRVEYYEEGGVANIRVWWDRL